MENRLLPPGRDSTRCCSRSPSGIVEHKFDSVEFFLALVEGKLSQESTLDRRVSTHLTWAMACGLAE